MPSRRSRSRQVQQEQEFEEGIPYIPPRSEELLLIEYLSSLKAERILCSSHGRGQLAGFLASQNPESRVICHYLDSHYASLTAEYWEESDNPPLILCEPDFPEEEFDVVCIPVHQQGNAELTRDFLQQGHQRLVKQGKLIAAVNNPRDHWLYDQFRAMFDKVTRIPKKKGVIYVGVKTAPLKKVRQFQAEFTANWQGRELQFVTRPGVFSHRHLDDGAWALMKALPMRSGMRVLDLGCGCGAVGIAAMLSGDNISVTAVDADSRAVQVTGWNADKNLTAEQRARFQIVRTHTAQLKTSRYFDLVATNPPYFSHFQIAELFLEAAKETLKPSGKLLLVTKMPEWYEEHLPRFFADVSIRQQGSYHIVQGENGV